MKISTLKHLYVTAFIFALFVSGCGYTTRSLLPSDIKTIRVENFKNEIKVTAEQSNLRMYRGYRPGMEVDLTRTIINKFLMDGSLRISGESGADIVLSGGLIDFKRDALRYDANDNIEEYRIKLIVNMELTNVKTGALMWQEKGFAGETTYRTGGPLAKTETAAVNDAIEDLSRRVVERTVEAW
ncbi:MAG: LPS assembly lipoprotein LptE [Candidatus Omnitrophota bacterium]|nr:LPS assembly lipoprotein LptE [Candidatus Omnitrophota bacterium]